MIKINGLTKSYGKHTVLDKVQLNVNKGEMVAIMGKSGSGKSTLLNIVGRFLDFDNGDYFFDGKPYNLINLVEFKRRCVGYVAQKPIMLNDRNIKENIKLGIDLYNLSPKEKQAALEKISSRLSIHNLFNKKPMELSGGELQKVAIARSLIYPKPVILADEPTGALDSYSSEEVMRVFVDLNNSGTTILLVTHDIDIANYCTRTILIRDGKIL